MATYLLRDKVTFYQKQKLDFIKNPYIQENNNGTDFHDQEDHGHLLKRIVMSAT